MADYLGTFHSSATAFAARTHVGFQFTTHDASGANVAPNSAFEAADIRIYRAADGAAFSATQRSSAAGITMTSPFDSLEGFHSVDIDLTDNTDAGFYAAGYRYEVVLAPDETVDGQTITAKVLARFDIGPSSGAQPDKGWTESGIAQSATATTIRLRSGATFGDDTPIGSTVWAYGSTQGYWQAGVITDYVSSTDTAAVPTWPVTPSGTISYIVFGSAPGTGVAQTGDAYAAIAGIPAAVLAAAALTPIEANVKAVNDEELQGAGTSGDKWRPA